MLSHIGNWVDAGARGFYASAMRAPTHMRLPLGFSALFHQSSHFGFESSSFEPVFELMLGMCILNWFLCRRTLSIGAP